MPTKPTQHDIRPENFGAVGDGTTFDTSAIQAAIDACSSVGGGRVTLTSRHTYLSGSLQLKEGVELHLEEGSVLQASSDYSHYSPQHRVDRVTDGLIVETVLPRRAFIVGFQAHGCSFTGSGKISGGGVGFIHSDGEHIHTMRAPEPHMFQYLERPFTIYLIDSHDVMIHDIQLDDPAFWALRLSGCDNAVITGVTLTSDMKIPNADGIDIDRCENVEITSCTITTADDPISIKSCAGTAVFGDTANIRITDCTLETRSGAITIGTESVGLIADVIATRCDVRNSHRGFAVRAREGGLIRNVTFRDSTVHTLAFSPEWWGHGEALHVTAFRWSEPEHLGDGNPERTLFGEVENIVFENLQVHTEGGVLCWAQQPGLIRGVTFSQVDITIEHQSSWPPRIDLRPNDVSPVIARSHNGFEIVNSDGVRISHCDVAWPDDAKASDAELVFAENSDVSVFELTLSQPS